MTMTRAALIAAASSAALIGAAAQPIAGDNLGLWPCGTYAARQSFAYATAAGPLQYELQVNGTVNPSLVVDISGPSNATGTQLHIWGSYSPVHPNQQWAVQPASGPVPAAITLVSLYNSMCIAAQGPYIGSPVVIMPCNASDPLQQWVVNANLSYSSVAAAGMCIQGGANSPSCDIAPFSTYAYCNPALPVAQRVADLLSRMTPAEKAAALDSSVPAIPRLGVPSMHSGEALHGAATGCLPPNATTGNTGCPTSFPCPMAMGASFDSQLWGDVGQAIGYEDRVLYTAGLGAVWNFAPNINPARSPIWGRNQETPGEDALLVSEYARSFIRGLQGVNASQPQYLLAAATAKHAIGNDLEGFIPRIDPQPAPPSGYCDTPGGCQRWNMDANPPSRDLAGYYAAPFVTAVVDADVRSIMCAYSGIFGQPSCASDLLQELLRNSSWDGHIVSDCTALELMGDQKWDGCAGPAPPLNCTPDYFPGHNYTDSAMSSINAAFNAGVDMNCGPLFNMWLAYGVSNGSVPSYAVDTAVTRVYTTAVKLGLLDPSAGQQYPLLPLSTVDSPEHRALALQAAEESLVLLRNDPTGSNNQPLLPLANGGKGLKLAFIGPHANSTQELLSNYHGSNTLVNSHSPLQAAVAAGLNVQYARGCNICDIVPPGFPNMPCPPGDAVNASGIAPAAALAAAADVAIVFVGNDQTSEAENFDRDSITLPGVQEQLVQAVYAAQPNTIVVFISGGVVSSPWTMSTIPSILQAFYGGELGGDAIVNALTGAVSPAGRLPLTLYYPNITARDVRAMDLAAEGGITHNFFTGPVLRPFGYGSGYSTFTYSAVLRVPGVAAANGASNGAVPVLQLPGAQSSKAMMGTAGSAATVGVEVTVTNTGAMRSDHVVLGFISLPPAYTADGQQPRQRLFGFSRLRSVAPGESRTLTLHVSARDLGVYTEDWMWQPAAGTHTLRVGDTEAPVLLQLQCE